jgi:hypothetical protein
MRQVSHDGKIATRFQTHHSQGGRHHHSLHLVVWFRNALKGGQTTQSFLATGCFLMDHTTNRAPYHHRGSLEVERTSCRVGVHVLGTELRVLDAIAYHYKYKIRYENRMPLLRCLIIVFFVAVAATYVIRR